MAIDEHKRQFIRSKLEELRDYVATQGVSPVDYGSLLLGYGAGLVAAHAGIPVAMKCMDMAEASIEHFYGPKKTN